MMVAVPVVVVVDLKVKVVAVVEMVASCIQGGHLPSSLTPTIAQLGPDGDVSLIGNKNTIVSWKSSKIIGWGVECSEEESN